MTRATQTVTIGASAILLAGALWLWTSRTSRPLERPAPSAAPVSRPPAPAGVPAFDSKERVAVAPQPGEAGPIRTLLAIHAPMEYGDFVWNERGVPDGPVWVRVDLHEQLLSVFRAGHEIGTAVILYGADKKPTPIGSFPILAKLKDHRSGLYDAPMPYTLRLTGDGVAIHGSNVRWGAATHGCVGVPTDFAARLFAAVRTGDKVTIVGRTGEAPPAGA